jgi:hypothetical protein
VRYLSFSLHQVKLLPCNMSFPGGYGEFGEYPPFLIIGFVVGLRLILDLDFQLLTVRPLCSPNVDPKLPLSRAWLGEEDSNAGDLSDTSDIANVIGDISSRLSPALISKLQRHLQSTYHHSASPLNRVLGLIASLGLSLRKAPEQSVSELVGSLVREGIISSPPDPDEPGRDELGRLVLSCLGWLTRLYRLPDEISNEKPDNDVDTPSYLDRPFFEFIINVGPLMTSRNASYQSSNDSDPREPVQVVCLDAHTLTTVGHITIDWTDSLGKHLQFDERGRVLSLFRLPSFCRLHQSPGSILSM